MTRSEKLAWGLGVIICVVIPLALGYYGLPLAGWRCWRGECGGG